MLSNQYNIAHKYTTQPVFNCHVSKNARIILDLIINSLTNRCINDGGSAPFITEFGSTFEPIIYDNAVLQWEFKSLRKWLEQKFKPNSLKRLEQSEILELARLVPLYNEPDLIDQGKNGSFKITTVNGHKIYTHISYHFVLDDYSEFDLLKISEISNIPFDIVQQTCNQIESPSNKFISYIYRVLKNKELSDQNTNIQNSIAISDSESKLKKLVQDNLTKGYTIKYDPNWIHDIQITKRLLDE
jgi:hypothetical protein